MAKILLVEDDTNLSEIYQARLQAEGYQIVSAHDGEEALALAAKEKPDLVISDVMMPKISGFEMLDILRNTPDLKNAKVIMLTALGQAEDKTRAEGLGADRYLVKSQVTLEDIVKAAQELLNASTAPATTPVSNPTPAVTATPAPTPAAVPTLVSAPVVQETATNTAPPPVTAATPVQTPVPAVTPATTAPPQPQATPTIPVATPPATAPAPAAISMPPQTPAATVPPTPATTQPASTLAEPMSGSTSSTAASPVISAADALASAQKAFEPSSFVPPAPTPTSTPANDNAAADDKVVSDAVKDLLGDTKTPPSATNSVSTTPTAAPVVPVEGVATTPSMGAQTPQAAPETTESLAPTPTAAEAVPAPQAPAAEAPAASPVDDANSNVSIAHKKIIRPIDNPNPRPDLDSLLAAEEQRNPGAMNTAQTSTNGNAPNAPLQPPIMHQPGNVFKPTSSAPNQSQNGVDPNSIAL